MSTISSGFLLTFDSLATVQSSDMDLDLGNSIGEVFPCTSLCDVLAMAKYFDLYRNMTVPSFRASIEEKVLRLRKLETMQRNGQLVPEADVADCVADVVRSCDYNMALLVPYYFPNYLGVDEWGKANPLSLMNRPFTVAMFHIMFSGCLTIRGSRQVGKSVTFGARQRIMAHMMPNFKSLYIAPHPDQVKNYVNKLDEMMRAFRFTDHHPNLRKNLYLKQFKNGSQLEAARVYTNADNIRGKSADELLVDESMCGSTNIAILCANLKGFRITNKKLFYILPGDYVVSYDAQGKLHKRKVTHTYDKGSRHVWNVVFSDGSNITCTGNTRFRTSKGYQYLCEFITPEEAKICDRTYKIKSLILAAETAFVGDAPWRRQHGPIEFLRRALRDQPRLQAIGVRVEETGVVRGLHTNPTQVSPEQGVWESKLHRQHLNNSAVRFYKGTLLSDESNSWSLGENGELTLAPSIDLGGDSLVVHGRRIDESSRTSDQLPWIHPGGESLGDLTPVYIDSITYAGEENVYDIETEEHHNFFANGIAVHNCQHFDPALYPELEQVQRASKMKITIFAGTALTNDTALETRYQKSSQGRWMIKCHHCEHWINTGDAEEAISMIRPAGPTCPSCSGILNVRNGCWHHPFKKNLAANWVGLHIPQLIIPDYVEDPVEWATLYRQFREYRGGPKFYQEVLGIPTEEGSKELSEGDVMRMCCLHDNPEQLLQKAQSGFYKWIISGVDWGGSEFMPEYAIRESNTVHTIIGVRTDGTTDLLFFRQHAGMGYRGIVQDIVKMHQIYCAGPIAVDAGVGESYIQHLLDSDIPADRILIFKYTSNTDKIIKASTHMHRDLRRFNLNRNETLTALFQAIKREDNDGGPRIRCYNYEYAKRYVSEFLNLYRVPHENIQTGLQGYLYRKHGSKPDDSLHAVNFAFTLARLLLGENLIEDAADRAVIQNSLLTSQTVVRRRGRSVHTSG